MSTPGSRAPVTTALYTPTALQRIHLETDIAAPAGRVWRALCLPGEVVTWDSSVLQALDAPPDYPLPGQHVRWRCRSGPFRLLHDRPQRVDPERCLRSLLDLGPDHLDETYTLTPAGASACHLDLTIDLSLRFALGLIPLLGPLLERRAVAATEHSFAASLANLKQHCESTP